MEVWKVDQVFLAACASYNRREVEKAVHSLFHGWKGIQQQAAAKPIQPGMRVLVKPNLLVGDSPEKGITTHPEVVRAVLKELLDLGAVPIVGDSPGVGRLARVAEKTGIAAVCRELGVKLGTFNEAVQVKTGSCGKIMPSFPLAKELLEVEAVINLPKMKTHGMARMTGCVKNLYGCIVGARKAELHFRLQKTEVFMEMLIDLAETICPVFNIVDAVMAMEGPGPRNGKLRPVGLLMAGTNPFAVDTVIAHLMGLKVQDVSLLALAEKRGKTGVNLKGITTSGADLKKYFMADYQVPAAPFWMKLRVPEFVSKLVRRYVSPYPVLRDSCRLCGVCVRSCPAEVMSIRKKRDKSRDKFVVYIDEQKCIRCYCCQELCPHNAIELKLPLLRRIFLNFF